MSSWAEKNFPVPNAVPSYTLCRAMRPFHNIPRSSEVAWRFQCVALDIQILPKSGTQVGLVFAVIWRQTFKTRYYASICWNSTFCLFREWLSYYILFFRHNFDIFFFCMAEIDLPASWDGVHLTHTSGSFFFEFIDNLFTRYPLLSAALGQTIPENQATAPGACTVGTRNPLNWSSIFFRKSVITVKR